MKIYFSPDMVDFQKIGYTETKKLVSVLWYRYRQYIPIEVFSPIYRFLSGNLDFQSFIELVNHNNSLKEIIYRERLINQELKTVLSLF